MKSVLGFGIGETEETAETPPAPTVEQTPVRSLALVRFIGDGRAFTYYNDLFDLAVGDRVFVSGKLAGKPGIVEKITTKFRINTADYKRVIAKTCTSVRGTYEAMIDKMVSYDGCAMSPEEFRSWILPPKQAEGDEEGEILTGEGYELSLPNLEEDEETEREALDKAVEYCRSGKVAYISVINGVGKAFIEGSKWYEIDFRLNGDMMTGMYCECMYPGLCKHLLAAAITIRALAKTAGLDTERDFTAIDKNRFWSMVAPTAKRVTL